jgi:hypothetical protein
MLVSSTTASIAILEAVHMSLHYTNAFSANTQQTMYAYDLSSRSRIHMISLKHVETVEP